MLLLTFKKDEKTEIERRAYWFASVHLSYI